MLKRSRSPLSYVQAAPVSLRYFRGSDMNNTFQNWEIVVDEDWSKRASSCDKDLYTVSSQTLGDLGGCYIKTVQHKSEAIYTLADRMAKKYMVATNRVKESNVSPNVRDLANFVEL